MTLDQMKSRQQEVIDDAAKFADMLRSRVLNGKLPPVPNEDERSSTNVRNLVADYEDEYEANEDSDITLQQEISPTSEEDDDLDDINEQVETSVEYEEMAREFMNMLLTNSLREVSPSGMVKCPACLDDDTMPQNMKDKTRTPGYQAQHILDKTHSQLEQFRRRMAMTAQEKKFDGRYYCPFCIIIVPKVADNQSFLSFSPLMKHIAGSDDTKIDGIGEWKKDASNILLHDQLKKGAGFYEDTWAGNPEVLTRRRKDDHRRLARKAGIYGYAEPTYLNNPIAHPFIPGLVYGSHQFRQNLRVPSKFRGLFTITPPPADIQVDHEMTESTAADLSGPSAITNNRPDIL